MSNWHMSSSPDEEPEAGTPRTRPRPSRGICASSALMPPRSWWSRHPGVRTWGSAPPASKPRRWRRSRCSQPRRASRPSGIRSATQTGWPPIVRPWGPCRRGGIAAWRPRPPESARVGAIGCAGARTRRRDPRRCRAPGTVHQSAEARGRRRARVCSHARVRGAC